MSGIVYYFDETVFTKCFFIIITLKIKRIIPKLKKALPADQWRKYNTKKTPKDILLT